MKSLVQSRGFLGKIPGPTSAVESESTAMKQDNSRDTQDYGEKASYAWSHKDSSDLLLRLVIKLLITVIGSSFHRYLIMYSIWTQHNLFAPKSSGIWPIISLKRGKDGSWYLEYPFLGHQFHLSRQHLTQRNYTEYLTKLWLCVHTIFPDFLSWHYSYPKQCLLQEWVGAPLPQLIPSVTRTPKPEGNCSVSP